MLAHTHNLLINPQAPFNLRSLKKVKIHCNLTGMEVPGISSRKLKKEAQGMLEEAGLIIDNSSTSVLVISIATESRPLQSAVVYALQVELREKVALARNAEKPIFGDADTWRHQSSTGVVFAPFNQNALIKGLFHEAIQQVDCFVNDWSNSSDDNPDTPTDTKDDDSDNTDTLNTTLKPEVIKAIREKLQELLSSLAVGNASKTTIDRFDVTGTKISFRATITHRQTNSPTNAIFLVNMEVDPKIRTSGERFLDGLPVVRLR